MMVENTVNCSDCNHVYMYIYWSHCLDLNVICKRIPNALVMIVVETPVVSQVGLSSVGSFQLALSWGLGRQSCAV